MICRPWLKYVFITIYLESLLYDSVQKNCVINTELLKHYICDDSRFMSTIKIVTTLSNVSPVNCVQIGLGCEIDGCRIYPV